MLLISEFRSCCITLSTASSFGDINSMRMPAPLDPCTCTVCVSCFAVCACVSLTTRVEIATRNILYPEPNIASTWTNECVFSISSKCWLIGRCGPSAWFVSDGTNQLAHLASTALWSRLRRNSSFVSFTNSLISSCIRWILNGNPMPDGCVDDELSKHNLGMRFTTLQMQSDWVNINIMALVGRMWGVPSILFLNRLLQDARVGTTHWWSHLLSMVPIGTQQRTNVGI